MVIEARFHPEVHQGTLPLSAMDKYDRPVGIGPLITVDTTRPIDVAAVAAEIRRLHTSRDQREAVTRAR
jgi:hypothetical protein